MSLMLSRPQANQERLEILCLPHLYATCAPHCRAVWFYQTLPISVFIFRILRSIEISVCFWIVYPNDQIRARAVNKQESRLYSDSATQLLFLPVPMAVLPTVSFGNSTTKFQNRVTVRISVTPFNVFIRFWPNCPLVARPSKKIYTLEHFLLAARSFFPEQQTNM